MWQTHAMPPTRASTSAGLLLVVVACSMISAASVSAQDRLAQADPMEITTDTPEYCQKLLNRIGELIRLATAPVPRDATDLTSRGPADVRPWPDPRRHHAPAHRADADGKGQRSRLSIEIFYRQMVRFLAFPRRPPLFWAESRNFIPPGRTGWPITSHGTSSRADAIIAAHSAAGRRVLPILHALQAVFGCIPLDAEPLVAAALNLSRAEIHGIVTFYHEFRRTPPGRHMLHVCRAEACQSVGGEATGTHLRRAGCRLA